MVLVISVTVSIANSLVCFDHKSARLLCVGACCFYFFACNNHSFSQLTKGSEIKLCVNGNNRVGDIRKMLTKRTGLPLEHIQLRFRVSDLQVQSCTLAGPV